MVRYAKSRSAFAPLLSLLLSTFPQSGAFAEPLGPSAAQTASSVQLSGQFVEPELTMRNTSSSTAFQPGNPKNASDQRSLAQLPPGYWRRGYRGSPGNSTWPPSTQPQNAQLDQTAPAATSTETTPATLPQDGKDKQLPTATPGAGGQPSTGQLPGTPQGRNASTQQLPAGANAATDNAQPGGSPLDFPFKLMRPRQTWRQFYSNPNRGNSMPNQPTSTQPPSNTNTGIAPASGTRFSNQQPASGNGSDPSATQTPAAGTANQSLPPALPATVPTSVPQTGAGWPSRRIPAWLPFPGSVPQFDHGIKQPGTAPGTTSGAPAVTGPGNNTIQPVPGSPPALQTPPVSASSPAGPALGTPAGPSAPGVPVSTTPKPSDGSSPPVQVESQRIDNSVVGQIATLQQRSTDANTATFEAVAGDAEQLAASLERKHLFVDAAKCYQIACSARERFAGTTSATLLKPLLGEAHCDFLSAQYNEAINLYQRTLNISEQLTPPDSTAKYDALNKSLHGLSSCYLAQGNGLAALPFSQRIYDLTCSRFGAQSPQALWSAADLGESFRLRGMTAQLKSFEDQIFDICTARIGGASQLSALDPASGMSTAPTPLSVMTDRAGSPLPIRFWTPAVGPARATLICVHGMCLHAGSYESFARTMANRGFLVVGLDVRGFGSWINSQGLDYLNLDACLADMENIAARLKKIMPNVPIFLVGESMGGGIVLHAGAKFPKYITGIISSVPAGQRFEQKKEAVNVVLHVGLGLDQVNLAKSLLKQATQIPAVREQWQSDKLARTLVSPKELISFQVFMTENSIFARRITKPILVVQGMQDQLVKPEGTEKIFDAIASPDKTLLKRYNGEHLAFEMNNFTPETIETVTTWLNQHCSGSAQPTTAERSVSGQILVEGTPPAAPVQQPAYGQAGAIGTTQPPSNGAGNQYELRPPIGTNLPAQRVVEGSVQPPASTSDLQEQTVTPSVVSPSANQTDPTAANRASTSNETQAQTKSPTAKTGNEQPSPQASVTQRSTGAKTTAVAKPGKSSAKTTVKTASKTDPKQVALKTTSKPTTTSAAKPVGKPPAKTTKAKVGTVKANVPTKASRPASPAAAPAVRNNAEQEPPVAPQRVAPK